MTGPAATARPWYRMKAGEEIVRDALRMAAQKAAAGCGACADAYLDLARQHGAADEDIRAALGWASDQT